MTAPLLIIHFQSTSLIAHSCKIWTVKSQVHVHCVVTCKLYLMLLYVNQWKKNPKWVLFGSIWRVLWENHPLRGRSILKTSWLVEMLKNACMFGLKWTRYSLGNQKIPAWKDAHKIIIVTQGWVNLSFQPQRGRFSHNTSHLFYNSLVL